MDVERSERQYPWSIDPEGPFNYVDKRKIFVGKVFAIVAIMLAFLTVMAFTPFMSDEVAEFYYTNYLPIIIVSIVAYIITATLIFCCEGLRKSTACGIALLMLMALSLSMLLAVQSSMFKMIVIALSILVTGLIVIAIGFVAKWGPWDITGCGMLLFVLLIGLVIYGLVSMIVSFFYYIPILHTIYAGIAVVLFSLYLWFDLQLVMGGRRVELDTDEYVLASAMLFIDIFLILYHTITIVGSVTSSQ